MKNHEEFKNELAALGERGAKWTSRKEIRELNNILDEDEHILALTRGAYDGRNWILAATDKRILFMDKVMFVGIKHLEIKLSLLETAVYEKGAFSGSIIFIREDGGKCIVSSVDKSSGPEFCQAINEYLNPPEPEAARPVPTVAVLENRMFEYTCPHCQAKLGVDNTWINMDLECPECHSGIRPRPTLTTIAPSPRKVEAEQEEPDESNAEIKPVSGYKYSTFIFPWWFWLILSLMIVFLIVGTSQWFKGSPVK